MTTPAAKPLDAARDALLVFAKVPTPGRVKTRLTAQLTPEDAASLYEAFLRDALAQYIALGVAVRLYLAPPLDALPTGLVPDGVTVHAQQGPDLGSRMQAAFLDAFAAGYQRLVIIGTDHPTLPTPFLDLAYATLSEPLALCLGPSDDGGYYLLGMNDFYPQVFHDMTYSHDAVFAQTLDRAQRTRATVTVLPPWYDVDTPEALERLVQDLADPTIAVPQTRRVLARLGLLP